MSGHLACCLPLNSEYFRSTAQAAPSMSIQRPAIEYSSSGSRIEELPDYDPGPVSVTDQF